MIEKTLGSYIKNLIVNKKQCAPSRKIAQELGITAQYMHDIENDNRVPSNNILKKIENLFCLDEIEKHVLYDLAAKSYKEEKVPSDIAEYIINNSDVRTMIRELMKNGEFNRGEMLK